MVIHSIFVFQFTVLADWSTHGTAPDSPPILSDLRTCSTSCFLTAFFRSAWVLGFFAGRELKERSPYHFLPGRALYIQRTSCRLIDFLRIYSQQHCNLPKLFRSCPVHLSVWGKRSRDTLICPIDEVHDLHVFGTYLWSDFLNPLILTLGLFRIVLKENFELPFDRGIWEDRRHCAKLPPLGLKRINQERYLLSITLPWYLSIKGWAVSVLLQFSAGSVLEEGAWSRLIAGKQAVLSVLRKLLHGFNAPKIRIRADQGLRGHRRSHSQESFVSWFIGLVTVSSFSSKHWELYQIPREID